MSWKDSIVVSARLSGDIKDKWVLVSEQIQKATGEEPKNSDVIKHMLDSDNYVISIHLDKDKQEILDVWKRLINYSNNLNQIARSLNYFKKLDIVKGEKHDYLLKDIDKLQAIISNNLEIIRGL